jgi:hypothetical protein
MAAWKTGVTRISETSKWYPRKYQVHNEDRGERNLALVTRRLDGTLGHTVCRKPIYAELYLHTKSEHDPTGKSEGLASYVTQVASGRNYSTLSKSSNKTFTE